MAARTEPSSFPGAVPVTVQEAYADVRVFGTPSDDQSVVWSSERRRFEFGAGGSGGGWDTTTLDLTSGSWTHDCNSSLPGTWTFNAGVISQTVDDADDAIQYASMIPGNTTVIEFDVRFPTGQDAGTTPAALLVALSPPVADLGAANTPIGDGNLLGMGAGLVATSTGDGTSFDPTPSTDGNLVTGAGAEITVTQDAWHTVRAMVDGVLQRVYVDDVFVATGQDATGGNNMGNPNSGDLAAWVQLGAVGLVDFRNVTVATQAFS